MRHFLETLSKVCSLSVQCMDLDLQDRSYLISIESGDELSLLNFFRDYVCNSVDFLRSDVLFLNTADDSVSVNNSILFAPLKAIHWLVFENADLMKDFKGLKSAIKKRSPNEIRVYYTTQYRNYMNLREYFDNDHTFYLNRFSSKTDMLYVYNYYRDLAMGCAYKPYVSEDWEVESENAAVSLSEVLGEDDSVLETLTSVKISDFIREHNSEVTMGGTLSELSSILNTEENVVCDVSFVANVTEEDYLENPLSDISLELEDEETEPSETENESICENSADSKAADLPILSITSKRFTFLYRNYSSKVWKCIKYFGEVYRGTTFPDEESVIRFLGLGNLKPINFFITYFEYLDRDIGTMRKEQNAFKKLYRQLQLLTQEYKLSTLYSLCMQYLESLFMLKQEYCAGISLSTFYNSEAYTSMDKKTGQYISLKLLRPYAADLINQYTLYDLTQKYQTLLNAKAYFYSYPRDLSLALVTLGLLSFNKHTRPGQALSEV